MDHHHILPRRSLYPLHERPIFDLIYRWLYLAAHTLA